ncbi:MAG: BTAD domain-containing putative transcriptional regulator [Anaerolineales bacterium]
MSNELQIRLLGGLQILLDNTPLDHFISNKVPALFAYLVVTKRAHQRDALAALLWGEMSDADAKNNLRQALSNLRKFLDPYLLVTRDTVQFNASAPHTLDVDLFVQGVQPDQQTSKPTNQQTHKLQSPISNIQYPISNIQQALIYYKGDFLQGIFVREAPEFEDWAYAERVRLREMAFQALQTLTAHHQKRGEYPQAIQTATRLLTFDPWREETHRQLILLYARSGQRTAALIQYEQCRRVLAKELDVEPSAETTALYERIRAAGDTCPNNLTLHPTSFVGRTHELEHLDSLFTRPDCRLITLLGPGGIGKTRLALQAARHALQRGLFLSGVFFVPLEGVDNPALIPTAIAEACGLAFAGNQDPKTQLLTYLKSREILLILDNFEQLLDGVSWLVQLLQNAPRIQLLVTSRERLNVQWEWTVSVEGLDYPARDTAPDQAAQTGAVQLFTARAQAARLDFALTPETLPVIVRICQLVTGTPLALELAAAQMRYVPCTEIETEIAKNFDFLSATFRDLPTRQRSLRAVFDWSWTRLAPNEQAAFRRLSVFTGAFSREAAVQVAEASYTVLSTLANQSLVWQQGALFKLHEVSRQFGIEKLKQVGETEDIQNRHACYYTQFLSWRAGRLQSAEQQTVLAEIEQEYPNVQAAWDWMVARREAGRIAEAMDALYHFMAIRSMFRQGVEIFSAARQALSPLILEDQGVERVYCRATAREGRFLSFLSRFAEANQRLLESLERLRRLNEPDEMAFVLGHLGGTARMQGNLPLAEQYLREGLSLRQQTGNLAGQAVAWLELGGIAFMAADYAASRDLCLQGLAIAEKIGDLQTTAHLLTGLSLCFRELGQYETALQYGLRSREMYQRLDDRYGVVQAALTLGELSRKMENYDEAQRFSEQAVAVSREIGHLSGEADGHFRLGQVALATGDLSGAKQHQMTALELATEIGETPIVLDALYEIGKVLLQKGAYTEAAFLLGWLQGQPEVGNQRQTEISVQLAGLASTIMADAPYTSNDSQATILKWVRDL